MLVTEQEAALLRRPTGGHARGESSVLSLARELGVTISPQHPGVRDPTLSRYFVAQLPERATAEQLVSELLAVPEVESAFLKPDEEPAT